MYNHLEEPPDNGLSRSGCPMCISVGENCLDWCGKTHPSVVAPFVTLVEDYGVEEGRGVPGMQAFLSVLDHGCDVTSYFRFWP